MADFRLDCPLLILASSVEELEPRAWESGEAWVDHLDRRQGLRGVILPLELRSPNSRRQQLWGMELLSWLRWSASESNRFLPVLAVAWQSLHTLLHRRPNLLLVADGARFARLPELLEEKSRAIAEFIQQAQTGKALRCSETSLEKYMVSYGQGALRLTHHALANDYYAAYRFWKGYLYALQEAKETNPPTELLRELAEASGEKLECQRQVERSRRQPWFKRYQFSLRSTEYPAYAEISSPELVLSQHVKYGLPENVRILFVDDEFDKGMGETLLRILFRQREFTHKLENEWVYSSAGKTGPKARFVCVRNTTAARCWLLKWRELPLDYLVENAGSLISWQLAFDQWCEEWRIHLRQPPVPEERLKAERNASGTPEGITKSQIVLGEGEIDEDIALPVKMTTVVLLDLRLIPDERGSPELKRLGLYSPHTLPSVLLRDEVKSHDKNTPVFVFTASRQAANYAEVMSSATAWDGWLCKEGPDIREDDKNSRNAVIFLLEQVHLLAAVKEWFRPAVAWSKEKWMAYAGMRRSPHGQECLAFVERKATQLLSMVRGETFAKEFTGSETSYWGGIRKTVQFPHYEEVVQRLVARRVAVGTLVWTARINKAGAIEWDAGQFAVSLRGARSKLRKGGTFSENAKAVADAVNFNEVLWFSSSKPELLRMLLPEEATWLLNLDLPNDKKRILRKELKGPC